MKKSLLAFIVLFLVSVLLNAQVIEDFNIAGSNGKYVLNQWGSPGLIDSIYQTTDPSGKSTGSLAVALNLAGIWDKDAIGLKDPDFKGKISSDGAQMITNWIYIPKNSTIPDSVTFELYYQPATNGKWTWTAQSYLAVSIPKGVWYPLTMRIMQLSISDSAGHYINGTNDIGDFGVQIFTGGNSSGMTWKGEVYFDNVSFLGKKPIVLADFAANLGGPNGTFFSNQWTNGWVDSVHWFAGPVGGNSGVAGIKLKDGSASTGMNSFGNQPDPGYDALGQNFLVFWVYVDTTFPDTFSVQTWAQSDPSWNWPPNGPETYSGSAIPKMKWYPIYFDLAQASLRDTVAGSYFNSFNNEAQNLRKYGIQVGGANGVDWKGTIYVDNVQLLNNVVSIPTPPPVWTAANFDSAKYGVQGFYLPSYATGGVQRFLDLTTSKPGYVLQGSVTISPSAKTFAVVRDNIPMQDADGDSIAMSVSFGVYLPAQMPKNGVVKFFVTDGTDSIAVVDTIGKTIGNGTWKDVTISKLDSLAQAGEFDPTKPARIGVAVYYPAPRDTTTWTGKIEFDDLKITGIMYPTQVATSVKKIDDVVRRFELYQNYPNPFNPSTKIKYDIAKDTKVSLRVFDILGREVAALVNENQTGGTYEITFNASKFASGVYLFKMEAGGFVKTHKMLLMK